MKQKKFINKLFINVLKKRGIINHTSIHDEKDIEKQVLQGFFSFQIVLCLTSPKKNICIYCYYIVLKSATEHSATQTDSSLVKYLYSNVLV